MNIIIFHIHIVKHFQNKFISNTFKHEYASIILINFLKFPNLEIYEHMY